jgi:hypothetical protein
MKKSLFTCAASALLALAFVVSCSDSGSGNEPIKKARITGVFQKGPFVEGTTATLNELNNDLSPTGRPYQTLITDDKGTFELRNVELVSPYAHLIATGFYRNEVTGVKSTSQITLQAIVDVTDKDNVNVNILTHLEYYRVLDLVDGGLTVKEAKKQAQKEIFALFGIDGNNFKDSEDMTIFGTTESDAALLAVSILMLGNLSEADFTSRLMNFSQAIKNGGSWDNEVAKNAIATWAANSLDNMNNIKSNILSWGLSSEIPSFEKYIHDYLVEKIDLIEKVSFEKCEAGLDECDFWFEICNSWFEKCNASFEICNAENEGVLVKHTEMPWSEKLYGRSASSSVAAERYYGCERGCYVCKNGSWTYANEVDVYCLESKTCEVFTDPRDGNKYRRETKGTQNQTWIIDKLRYTGENVNAVINYHSTYPYEARKDYYYSYSSLEDALIVCPNGWRLPSVAEIEATIHFDEVYLYGDRVAHYFDGYIWSNIGPHYIYYSSYDHAWSFENTNKTASVYCVKD